MSRTDVQRLEDALGHVDHALEQWSGIGRDGLVEDRIIRQAILYDLIVIGTTFAAIPNVVRNLAPDIAWKAIVRTRNRFVHAYWHDDVAFMVALLTIELPHLKVQLAHIVRELRVGE